MLWSAIASPVSWAGQALFHGQRQNGVYRVFIPFSLSTMCFCTFLKSLLYTVLAVSSFVKNLTPPRMFWLPCGIVCKAPFVPQTNLRIMMWGHSQSSGSRHHPFQTFFVCVHLECLVQVDGSGLNVTWGWKHLKLAGGGWRYLVSLCSGEYLTGWKMEFHESALPQFAWWEYSFSISKKMITPAVNENEL